MRRKKAKKILVLPDPKFNEVIVTKFVNNLMYSGKKSIAYKLFYDATLTRASLRIPQVHNLTFCFLNMTFNNPHSIFYFEDQIDFVGGVWYNIFKPPRATRCSVN